MFGPNNNNVNEQIEEFFVGQHLDFIYDRIYTQRL